MTGNIEGTDGTRNTDGSRGAGDAASGGSEDQELARWSQRLRQALQILDLDVDQKLVARLADGSANAVNRAAGPVTALLVGFAAGLAARNGNTAPGEALQSAADVALRLCEDGADGGPDSEGWSSTGQ